jgi:hypothetical protein
MGVPEIRRIVLVLCLTIGIALPASALAGLVFPLDNDYQGRLEGDPNTYFGFDVYKRHGKLKRVNRIATAIPLNCYSGDRGIVEVRVPGLFKVNRLTIRGAPRSLRRLKFFEVDERVDTDVGSGTVEAFGLPGPHGGSVGSISIHTRSADLGKCYSGTLGWKAQRGAHVTPTSKP